MLWCPESSVMLITRDAFAMLRRWSLTTLRCLGSGRISSSPRKFCKFKENDSISAVFAAFKTLVQTDYSSVEKTQKKTDYIKNDKVLCRVCETEMSRSKFLSHIGLCYKKTKKLLKITSISEEILNRIKKFERTRM